MPKTENACESRQSVKFFWTGRKNIKNPKASIPESPVPQYANPVQKQATKKGKYKIRQAYDLLPSLPLAALRSTHSSLHVRPQPSHLFASEFVITMATPTIVPSHATTALIRVEPTVPTIAEDNISTIRSGRLQYHDHRQNAVNTQCGGCSLQRRLEDSPDRSSIGVIDDDISIVDRAHTVLLALILLQVHGTPSRCVGGSVNDSLAAESESRVASHWYTTLPAQPL